MSSTARKFVSVLLVAALMVTALCALLSFASVVAEGGKTYYVSSGVEQGTVGEAGNPQKPYAIATLLGSSSILQPGDTVRVLPGTYELTAKIVIRVSGAFNNYITIENDSETEQATLSFYGMSFNSLNRGVEMYGDYIKWVDIDICGAGDNGMYIGGSYNIVEDCEFYDNRDTGLQIGRKSSDDVRVYDWPSYNLVKNCTSHNNYDNETYGENADGFAAKLTVGYGNVFDGCIAYRNSDDGWDLYAKSDNGNIGTVFMYNCVAFENGFLEYTQEECNAKFPTFDQSKKESSTNVYTTRDGDGNGFKLGGSVMEGDSYLVNCLSFNNKMHGVTDNSNPGVISLKNVTSVDNGRDVDNNSESATFGQVVASGDSCSNIDLARQTYSYNNMEGVLSAKSSGVNGLTADAYRGSVQNSIFCTASGNNNSYKVVALDADSANNLVGEKITAVTSSDVFEASAVSFTDGTYTLSGLEDSDNSSRIHERLRNADGSVNMGSLFAVKSDAKLIDGTTIGAVLNLTSYEAYSHSDLTNNYDSAATETDAILQAASDVLSVACNKNAVYQDFYLAANMMGVEISWSSNSAAVVIVEDAKVNYMSNAKFDEAIIYRDKLSANESSVILTATISAGDKTVTKDFVLNIMPDQPKLGSMYVVNGNDQISDGESIIISRFAIFELPQLTVENGSDYNGKTLSESAQYVYTTKYEYAVSADNSLTEVKGFTTSNAGVWQITYTATLLSDNSTKSLSYKIYVSADDAIVDFKENESQVSVNLDGFLISGELTNVTGYIYAFASATERSDITAANIQSLEDVQKIAFEADSVICQFSCENNGAYYVYYALANKRDEMTSELYSDKIDICKISTPEQFVKVASGEKLGSEDASKTIYMLTECLDFSNVTYTVGTQSFEGYINGNGHTVRNVTVNGAGLFFKFKGGTLTNIAFDNIDINNGTSQKTGIVSQCYGGNFADIKITNINVVGGQRTAALIGQILDASVPTVIKRVSVDNPIPQLDSVGNLVENQGKTYIIKAVGNRAAGLVGLIQPSNGSTDKAEVIISDCYVNSYITSDTHTIGGIVGELDQASGLAQATLKVTTCYASGVYVCTGDSSRIGGILGYHKGASKLTVLNCISLYTPWYADAQVSVAQKNLSGIIGNYSTQNAVVSRCVALFEEYNSDYGVTVTSSGELASSCQTIFAKSLQFGDAWEYVTSENGDFVSPYVKLVFKACDCD